MVSHSLVGCDRNELICAASKQPRFPSLSNDAEITLCVLSLVTKGLQASILCEKRITQRRRLLNTRYLLSHRFPCVYPGNLARWTRCAFTLRFTSTRSSSFFALNFYDRIMASFERYCACWYAFRSTFEFGNLPKTVKMAWWCWNIYIYQCIFNE